MSNEPAVPHTIKKDREAVKEPLSQSNKGIAPMMVEREVTKMLAILSRICMNMYFFVD